MLAAVLMQENGGVSAADLAACRLKWRAIDRAAQLAFEGREAEAEAVRFAAGYHNMAKRVDKDIVIA